MRNLKSTPVEMKYFCSTCQREHDGFPSWGADRPALYWEVPAEKRESDVFLTSDSCVIADRFFFIRACLDIPVMGTDETYSWGVWVSLSETNFFLWQDHYETPERAHIGPFFGWLCTSVPVYPDTLHLKTQVHLRDNGLRPLIELQESDHLLFRHQRDGIALHDLAAMMHRLEAMKDG